MTTPSTSLAQIAIDLPHAPLVFVRHGLDFCCHGQRTLAEACSEKGLDPRHVIEEIERTGGPAPAAESWSDRPLGELIDFILARYHAPLRADVAALEEMAQRVERRHADKPACPRGLAAHLAKALEALESHLSKEEQVLFPLIRAGRGGTALMPVKVMMQEHEDHGEGLRRTRALTAELVTPAEACATWRALYAGLARLEGELMEHIHLENNVLFPRALSEGFAER